MTSTLCTQIIKGVHAIGLRADLTKRIIRGLQNKWKGSDIKSKNTLKDPFLPNKQFISGAKVLVLKNKHGGENKVQGSPKILMKSPLLLRPLEYGF